VTGLTNQPKNLFYYSLFLLFELLLEVLEDRLVLLLEATFVLEELLLCDVLRFEVFLLLLLFALELLDEEGFVAVLL